MTPLILSLSKDKPAIALAELTRRRANASALVGRRKLPLAQAEQAVARWCGIAAWFGALLPEDLRPYEGMQLWTDHAPRGLPAQDWLHEIASQLRRDTQSALTRYEADSKTSQAEPLANRAIALLTLDRDLSLAAGLPAIGADSDERKAA